MENAFVKSEFPVIITFEDHLNPPLQAQAAEVSSVAPFGRIMCAISFAVGIYAHIIWCIMYCMRPM
jgi:hypothetical protein